jgi:N-acetylglucosamine-6-phosphate deacetylase
MLLINNGTLLQPGAVAGAGRVLIDGGKIAGVGASTSVPIPPGAAVLDAAGGYVVPGFIDVHVHGGGGADFMDATPEAVRTVCRFHASGGTTGLLATTAAAPRDDLLHTLDVVAGVRREGTGGAAILGVHLEGPYFAPTRPGCHLPGEVRRPDPAEYLCLLDRHPGLVRWVTLAPELDGAMDLIAALRIRGAVAAAGHTEADEPRLRQAIAAGLRHATHLYCAMSTIRKDGPRRIPGLVETALAADELTTEVIADGHHLAPALLTIAARAKGPAGLLLVTDAMRGAGMPDGTYPFGPPNGSLAIVAGGVARTPDNTGYASSTARANELVRNMVERAGCVLVDAVRMASTTPAGALGLGRRKGRLRRGYDADLVVLDRRLDVRATIVGGEIVYEGARSE